MISRFFLPFTIVGAFCLLPLGTSRATILQFSISDYVGAPIPAPAGKPMSMFAHYGDRAESETAFVPETGFEEHPFTYNYEQGSGFTPNISLKISASDNCEIQYYDHP